MIKPYWITSINDCEIGISPRPEGKANLRENLRGIVLDDHLLLVSLL